MGSLKGKIALITGGTSGMGAATAARFHAEGAKVVTTGSSETSVAAARAVLPDEVEVLVSNAGDAHAAETLVKYVAQRHGHIDILFVNAGIARVAPIEATDETVFDALFNVNLRGPYFLLKHAVPFLSDGASIILTSSGSAVQGIAGLSAYSATKAALRSLGRSLAAELAPRAIRVNTITPGPIDTPIAGKMGLSPEQLAGFAQMIQQVPLRRPGTTEEIASAALYFASDDSRFTTGTELRVDGGLTEV